MAQVSGRLWQVAETCERGKDSVTKQKGKEGFRSQAPAFVKILSRERELGITKAPAVSAKAELPMTWGQHTSL